MNAIGSRFSLGATAGAVVAGLRWGAALGQSYPVKPIRLLVPAGAGATPDVVARVVAQGLSQGIGQPIVIDNRAGVAGTIGLGVAAKSVADGYTIVMGTTGTLASAPGLYPNLRYDPVKSFAPISQLVAAPYVVAVHPSVASTLKELIDRAKAKPGQLHFGSGGSGGPPHIAGEIFKATAQVNLTHVPYKANPAATSDLVAGRLQVMFNQLVNFQSHAQAGKLTILCVAGPKRLVQLPNVPTAAEAGLPGYAVSIWFGLIAPRGVPQPILSHLNVETLKALASKDVQDAQRAQGFEPTGGVPSEFAALIAAESLKWQRAIKDSGAKLD